MAENLTRTTNGLLPMKPRDTSPQPRPSTTCFGSSASSPPSMPRETIRHSRRISEPPTASTARRSNHQACGSRTWSGRLDAPCRLASSSPTASISDSLRGGFDLHVHRRRPDLREASDICGDNDEGRSKACREHCPALRSEHRCDRSDGGWSTCSCCAGARGRRRGPRVVARRRGRRWCSP